MADPVNINQVPKLNLGLQETDEVFITRGGSGPYRVPASSFPWEQKGDKGDPGGSWAPVLALVTDGARLVHRVVDWVGGTGEKPAALGYVGAAGIVATAAAAVDVRGAQGVAGWAPVLAVVADGERRVQQVVDWAGGAGDKPATLGYIGATGIVATAAAAVDVRGAQGVAGWAPVLAVVADGARRVQQVVDWTGGAGDKPATLGYVGATGIVATAAAAVDVRGPRGTVSAESMLEALGGASPTVVRDIGSVLSGYVIANGLTLTVRPFRIGAFSAPGGSIQIAAAGTWYVGVEMWSGQVRLLPRLGHRGWVPVACVVASATDVTSIEQIEPVMPPTRIPRTMAKILAGQPIKAIVMGSSLTEGSASTNWAGMVFSGGSTAHYKIPNSTLQNIGLGGTPNQYQFAQLGFASATHGTNYNDGTYPLAIMGTKSAPNGRSSVFDGCDVVVIGMLANGDDYRLSCIEPIIRNLRRAGVEVIVATDNAQNPSTTYSTMNAAALYSDGPELMRIAELYGVEIADTAAYVFEAHLRASGTGIYSDSIHMMSGEPAGPAAVQPANGHEAWARAVRSIVHGSGVVVGPPIVTTRAWDWNGGSLDGVTAYSQGAVSLRDAKLVVTKNTAASNQWGASMPHVAPVRAGDTVVVSGTATWDTALSATWRPTIGLQGGGSGWGSNSPALVAPGPFSVTLTASRDALGTASYVLLFGNWSEAPLGAEMVFDDLRVTVNTSDPGSLQNRVPDRESQIKPLPAPRIVTDLRTPGDAFVILPADEHYVRTAGTVRGSLEAHPSGASSFARRFNAQAVGATADLLVLTAGKSAALSAFGVVGFAMVLYSVAGNDAATYEVYNNNNNLLKTVTIPAQTLTREIYHTIYTPTELNNASATPSSRTIDIRCTSGTIRIAALVALTFDLELLPIEMADRVGTWTGKVSGGGTGMPGYATDTAGSYAAFRAPDDARRLGWICSARPNGKLIDSWSDRSSNLSQASSGVSHVRVYGNHVGPGSLHYLRCAESLAGGGDGANGYALHVGGMVVVRDR